MAEHIPGKDEVGSSILPMGSNAPLAQWIERFATDEEVARSNRAGSATAAGESLQTIIVSYVRARIAKSSRLEVGSDQPGAFSQNKKGDR